MKHVTDKSKDFSILITITAEQRVRFKILASCGNEAGVAGLVRAIHEKRPQKMEEFHKLATTHIGCLNCLCVMDSNTRMPMKESPEQDEARKWFADARHNLYGQTHCYALIDMTAEWDEINRSKMGDVGMPFSRGEAARGVHEQWRGEVQEYKEARGLK